MIKAIETEYNGYKFRSRLEARWAVFFDAIGLKYQYEPEGFEVTPYDDDHTYRYLPDFYFPKQQIYGEVKANLTALKHDSEKIAYCIDWESTPISQGLMILGQIPYWDFTSMEIPQFPFLYCHKGIILTHSYFLKSKIYLSFSAWDDVSEAPELPKSIDYYSEDLYKLGYRTSIERDGMCFDLDSGEKINASMDLYTAFTKARQARFEHGEKPII